MFGTAQTTVVVNIDDVNEPPEFLSSHYTTVVSEGAEVGELLFSGIVAFDVDEVSGYIISYYKTIYSVEKDSAFQFKTCSYYRESYQWFIS
jgi:hypothetical protein